MRIKCDVNPQGRTKKEREVPFKAEWDIVTQFYFEEAILQLRLDSQMFAAIEIDDPKAMRSLGNWLIKCADLVEAS